MQKTPKRNKQAVASHEEPAALPADKKKRESADDFVALLPPEVCFQIFGELDLQSLCNAAMTCRSWNHAIENNDCLWRHHCLTVRAICQREIDYDRRNGYSWKITLLRNYWKSKVKQEWLSGKYSHVHSRSSLPEKSMYPMDADTWGEILEAELER
uniref:F-box protein 48 n=5 Tax=Tinamidae TaxID=8803 RepID=A0A8C7A091_NOTPE